MVHSQSLRHAVLDQAREQMVHSQLAGRDIVDPRVLAAMNRVPREEFVPVGCREQAFHDRALPIDCGQTISQPYTVAFMCQEARISPTDRVLEIGTGSGYGAAVLSELCQEVHTIERIPELAKQARERLQRLGYANTHVHLANGTCGLPEQAPFDVIVVTAAAEAVPQPYLEQLSEGGRVIIPVGRASSGQVMYRMTRQQGGMQIERLGDFAFVPLIGEFGHPPD